MEETDFDMLDMEGQTELEAHLYSYIHYNSRSKDDFNMNNNEISSTDENELQKRKAQEDTLLNTTAQNNSNNSFNDDVKVEDIFIADDICTISSDTSEDVTEILDSPTRNHNFKPIEKRDTMKHSVKINNFDTSNTTRQKNYEPETKSNISHNSQLHKTPLSMNNGSTVNSKFSSSSRKIVKDSQYTNGLNFDHNSIIANMIQDQNQWKINHADKYAEFVRRPKRKPVRCRNCNHIGHIKAECPDPIRPIKCFMCGLEGHMEPRCPNKLCLKCGAIACTFTIGCHKCRGIEKMTCSICDMSGHNENQCPDLWRRYHRSIDASQPPITQSTSLKDPQDVYCSNCSLKGHMYHKCNKFMFDKHGLLLPNIINYDATLPVESVNYTNSSINILNCKLKSNSPHFQQNNTTINGQTFLNNLNEFEAIKSDDSMDSVKSCFESNVHKVEGSPEKSNCPKALQFESQDAPVQVIHNISLDLNNLGDFERVGVDKETMIVLMKKEGSKFLNNASRNLGLKIQLHFSGRGGFLLFKDSQNNSNIFLKAFREWIKSVNFRLLNTTNSSIPRRTKPLLSYMRTLQNVMRKPIGNPLQKYKTVNKIKQHNSGIIHPAQVKIYHRNMKQLNILFFAQHGFREGESHIKKLEILTKQLASVCDTIDVTPDDMYDEIKMHHEYIFSSFDHGNYEELLALHNKKNHKRF